MHNQVKITINESLNNAIETLASFVASIPFSELDMKNTGYRSSIINIALRYFHEHIQAGGELDNKALYEWYRTFYSPTVPTSTQVRINDANMEHIEPIATALLPTSIGERVNTGRSWNRPLIVVISLAWLYHNHRSIIENYINLQRRD